jgi:microcystin-dependent protein
MSEPFIGEIRSFSFNFAPRGWAQCDGQLLQISQNQALFSILGTTYGGNGTTTFALPDLRGRGPVHPGSGQAGRRDVGLGQVGGEEAHTLTLSELGPHSHAIEATAAAGTTQVPTNAVPAGSPTPQYGTTNNATMDPAMVIAAGVGAGHENRVPYLTLNYCIALFGVFPSRN